MGCAEKAAQVLRQGLKKAPEDLRERFRSLYVYSQYRAGRWLQAYQEAEARDKHDARHRVELLLRLPRAPDP